MENKKSTSIIVAFLLVLTLIISSVGTLGTSKNMVNTNGEPDQINRGAYTLCISSESQPLTNPESLSTFDEQTISTLASYTNKNIVVSGLAGDESNPSIVINDQDVFTAYEYHDGSSVHLYARNSINSGLTWSSGARFRVIDRKTSNELEAKSPDVDIIPGTSQGYVACLSPYKNYGCFAYYAIPNIGGNIASFSTYSIDWTGVRDEDEEDPNIYYDFWNFSTPSIVCYDNTTTPWVIAIVGSTNYTNATTGKGPCTYSPMICFRHLEQPEKYVSMTWFPDIENCHNISIDNEYGNDTIYGVCEQQNGSKTDLLFFKGSPKLWNNSETLLNKTISNTESLKHPKILVKNTDIYITTETQNQGIILYHSNDQGQNWTKKNITKNITPTSSKPQNPELYVNETHLSCIFTLLGNLSLTYSNNSGVNWSDPTQINDQDGTVVSGYRYSDIGNNISYIWTDNRSGNLDIYYNISITPSVDIKIIEWNLVKDMPLLPTVNWIEVKVKNTGEWNVNDILINVSFECDDGNTTVTKHPGYIDYLAAGKNTTVRTPLFRFKSPEFFEAFIQFAGIENITVKLQIQGPYEDSDPGNNILKKPVLYEDIFTVLWPFEAFFKTLKNL